VPRGEKKLAETEYDDAVHNRPDETTRRFSGTVIMHGWRGISGTASGENVKKADGAAEH